MRFWYPNRELNLVFTSKLIAGIFESIYSSVGCGHLGYEREKRKQEEKRQIINKRKHGHLKFCLSLKLWPYHRNARIIDVTKSQQKYRKLLSNVDLLEMFTIVKIRYTVKEYISLTKSSRGYSATNSNYVLIRTEKNTNIATRWHCIKLNLTTIFFSIHSFFFVLLFIFLYIFSY